MFRIAEHGLFVELEEFGLLSISRIEVSEYNTVRVNDLDGLVRILIKKILDGGFHRSLNGEFWTKVSTEVCNEIFSDLYSCRPMSTPISQMKVIRKFENSQ